MTRTADQSEVEAFLAAPATHGAAVERLDTHTSVVFLADSRAYKLKRAVRFDYLDYSTLDRRRRMCEEEVRLNRRTAPDVYLGVVPVTRDSSGGLALDGPGAPVEWLVQMRRFPQEQLLDRIASEQRLDPGLMPPLAAAIDALHAAAAVRPDHGGRAALAWVVDGNAAGFREFGAGCLDPAVAASVTADARAELARQAARLDARRAEGFVRECHGDLHLRNIVLIDGRPVLFDGVEFNEAISCIDTMYDLAFLLMDLWRRRLPRHANALLQHSLEATEDVDGTALLPLFLSCRAAVRAKTEATAAQSRGAAGAALCATAREYLSLAETLLHPPSPCLVAVGGLSGSGKSTLARSLAPALGAVPGAFVLRSDVIRKRLAGVPLLERLGAEGYSPDMTARVYETLRARAARLLAAGHSVIADAVFARPADRQAIEAVAASAGVPFLGLWLDAPLPILIHRTEHRRPDPSDGNPEIVRRQHAAGVGRIDWTRIHAAEGPPAVYAQADAHLREWRSDVFNTARSSPDSPADSPRS